MAQAKQKTEKQVDVAKYKELATKSAQIRAMHADGFTRVEIKNALGLRYQHVRNVLTTPLKKKA